MLKVPVDEYEVATLEAALGLAADRGAALGASARAYVEREHALGRVADLYVAALETAAGGDAVDDAVLLRIAEAAAEVGIDDARRACARRRRRRDRHVRLEGSRAGLSGSPRSSFVSAAVRIALVGRMPAPWIMVDELIYSELGKSVGADGRFLVRGVPSSGYGFVYPVLIAPAFRALRLGSARLRGREGDQRLRHVARSGPDLLPRAPAADAMALARRRCARRGDPVDALHRAR